MNTEHTNQSSQAEPAPRNTTELQSVPKRQRDFTAENIRDIAHECMRIGDNEQAAVVFAIADALRDGNLIIQPPAQQQAEPVAAQCRFEGEEWKYCTIAHHLLVQAHPKEWPHYETRALYAQPPVVAVPDSYALVPIDATLDMSIAFAEAFYSKARAIDDDDISDWWAAMLAAAPQAAVAAPLPPYDVFSDDDGDSWEQHPASDNFVHGLQLGDEFELLAGWHAERVTFRVTKVPDDESDDYEVEEVTTPAAAQKGGAR